MTSTSQKSATATNGAGLTLADYAKAKHLPVEMLKKLGLSEVYIGGKVAVRIPYFNEAREIVATRFRLSMTADPRFVWKNGSKPLLYGLWNLDKAREVGYVCLSEGESDTQTLWYNKFPALGLPGAAGWREEYAELFDGFEKIFVTIEPDHGGEAILNWLRRSKIRHRVHLVRLNGAKDASALYLKDPQNFKPAWREAVAAAQPWEEFERAEIDARAEQLWEQCKELASRQNILDEFARALLWWRVAGEKAKAKLIYLALTSRLLDHIASMGPKGPSSTGKSFVTDKVLKFFPPSAYYVLTAMSDKALAYSNEPLAHRFLVLNEAAALGGDWVAYFVRSLLSEGRLVYETVEKTAGGLRSRRIEREGPTGLIVTTTAVALNPENETRFTSMQMDDTPEQTARILRAEAADASGRNSQDPEQIEQIVAPWRALQEWLAATDHRVVIPYAPAIADLVPPAAVRLRRDFKSFLSLVMAHALLHKATRKRDDRGRIVANWADYKAVRELAHEWIAEGAERTVSKKMRETVSAVARICSDPGGQTSFGQMSATVAEVATELKLDRSAAYRRIREAIERGFLQNLERIENGRALKVSIGSPMPQDEPLLPTVEQIIARIKEKRAR